MVLRYINKNELFLKGFSDSLVRMVYFLWPTQSTLFYIKNSILHSTIRSSPRGALFTGWCLQCRNCPMDNSGYIYTYSYLSIQGARWRLLSIPCSDSTAESGSGGPNTSLPWRNTLLSQKAEDCLFTSECLLSAEEKHLLMDPFTLNCQPLDCSIWSFL